MLRLGLKILVILSLLGVITLTVVSFIIIPTLPDIELLRDVQMQIPLRVYSADNSLIAEFGEKRRVPVSIEDTPQQMIDAFIAAEDGRFYEHPGVDWRGILRAVVNLVLTGEKSQGGSTITMQVARNFFLSREKTYLRKLNEIYLSLKIERELTKDEILELYLNVVFFGQRAHGVGAAAQVYYGTTVNRLTLPQIAMIAGLPQAPSTTNPVTDRNRATIRRNYVLNRMFEEGFITQEQYLEADATPITASLHSPSVDLEAPYVAEMVRREMQDLYGDDSTSMGYRVYTTIRNKNQVAANHALRSAVLEYDSRHGYRGAESHIELTDAILTEDQKKLLETFPVIANLYPALVTSVHDQSITVYLTGIGHIDIGWEGLSWARKYIDENFRGPEPTFANNIVKSGDIVRIIEDDEGQWRLSQLPSVEGAFISLNPRNGETLALTGGFDFYRSNFNRVIQAKRQPGSGFKPFIYSAALHEGYTAASIINDAPLIKDYPGIEDTWRPENYSGRYYGPTRLREALINSRNIASIRLLDAVGIDKTLKHISKFGFNTDALPHSLSLALGSGDLSPWEMASAYCVFANGGFLVEPYFIDRIEDNNGNVIFKANPAVVCEECLQKDEIDHTENSLDEVSSDEPEILSVSIDHETGESPSNKEFEITMVETDTNNDKEITVDSKVHKRYAPRVVDAQNIWIMNSITRDVIRRGTGMRARVLNRNDLSGKTGTTNDQHDAWFFGYNPHIVGVAWVGFDDFRPMGRSEVGGRAALPMWIDYMRVVLKDIPETILTQPSGLVTARIDPDTGQLAGADNPGALFEVFRAENAPTSVTEESTQGPFERESNETVPPLQLF